MGKASIDDRALRHLLFVGGFAIARLRRAGPGAAVGPRAGFTARRDGTGFASDHAGTRTFLRDILSRTGWNHRCRRSRS